MDSTSMDSTRTNSTRSVVPHSEDFLGNSSATSHVSEGEQRSILPVTSVPPSQTLSTLPTSKPKEEAVSLPPLFRLSHIVQDVVNDAAQAHEARRTGKPLGPVTGLKKVDSKMCERLPPGLVPVLGNTGAGKTAFCLQIAASCGCPALYISCEMSCTELFRRHMARVCGDYLNRYKSGEMPPREVERKAIQAAEAAPELAIMEATRYYPPPSHILQVAEVVRGDSPHLLIVLDSLHSWVESSASGVSEYDALNAGLARLREVAQYLSCPMIVISERNRASADSGGVNAGAGTRRIEYGAEVVFDLQRDKNAVPNGNGEVPIGLCFAKNRHGAPGETVQLFFNGALQRFREA